MKHEMVNIQSMVGDMSREKLTMLLPTHNDIREFIPALGCVDTETFGDVRHAQAIHQFVADIVATPTNHEAWRDLALAFGTNQMLRWKYLCVANYLKPDDYQILDALSFSHTMMGDTEGGNSTDEKGNRMCSQRARACTRHGKNGLLEVPSICGVPNVGNDVMQCKSVAGV